MKTIYKRELKSYFQNNIASVLFSSVVLIVGIFFDIINLRAGNVTFSYTLSSASVILLIIIPVLTMKSFTDDKKENTEKLLFSLPFSSSDIVLGKFFAMITVFTLPIVFICIFPIVINMFGSSNFILDYSSILAFYLLGIALISISMYISTHTSSPLISAVLSISVFFMIYLFGSFSSMLSGTAVLSYIMFIILTVVFGFLLYIMIKDFIISLSVSLTISVILTILYIFKSDIFENKFNGLLRYLALFDRISDFTYGIINISVYVLYISITVVFIIMSIQSVDRRRRA